MSSLSHPAAAPMPRASRARLHRLGTFSAALLLLLVVGVPSIPLYLFGASSMASGALLVCLLAAIGAGWLHAQRPIRPWRFGQPILIAWLAVGLHFSMAAAWMPVDTGRFAASWLLLLVFLLGARAVAGLLYSAPPAQLHRALRIVLAALLLVAAGGLLGIAPPAALPYEKPVFPFTEPSHFSLAFVPFLLYFAIGARGVQRLFWIVLGVALALQLQNMTLLAGTLLVALVCNLRTAAVVLPIAVLAAAPFLDLYYFASRLDFSPESDNLSTLVFVQGWQLIAESLQRSSFWGLGFQQLGIGGTDVQFAELIHVLMDTYVNLTDGGFTLSKLVSEFGLLGIALALLHLLATLRATERLRLHARGLQPLPAAQRLACAVVVGFTIELLVRGAGYFTGSSLLYAASLFYLLQTGGLAASGAVPDAPPRPRVARRQRRHRAAQPALPMPSGAGS